MPEMDGIEMTKRIRKTYRNNGEEEKEIMFPSIISPHSIQSRSLKKQNRGMLNECIIWAITAMNETEIEDMVGKDCLNGISVKPLCYKQLAELLYSYNLICHLADN
ncbi:hypothetical protein FGO68_gene2196 [Halteria grandinella]|uniref:Response regulatory domain-containing protein n=1 Tax=Halteria grandinella TaxID=5974 RepID=A0A8J8SWF5_HALGN|nr:hypothetical protein FGO68_gene2196 [Halteria grandinella]